MVVIVIIGSILAFITRSISKVSIDNNLARFKKAYAGIEDAISFLINDEIIYGTSSGFKDTEAVTLQNIGEIIGQSGVNKFRDAFKFRMHYVEDRINCPIYGGISSSRCFMTNYGVVFGIPDTDFVRTGTVKSRDSDNQTIDVVPITFYTNYEEGQTVNNNAFVATVTYDGKINFLYSINESKCTDNSTQMQCRLKKYIHADSVKRTESN